MKQPERGNVHECAEAALGGCGNTSAGWGYRLPVNCCRVGVKVAPS